MSTDWTTMLQERRRAEKGQALFYRGLAARAERDGDSALAQRFHDLHADEQHHLSRITARLIELGRPGGDLSDVAAPPPPTGVWEPVARAREADEIRGYEALLAARPDGDTCTLLREILEVERNHAAELGGKWTMA